MDAPDFQHEVMPSGAETMFTVVTGVPMVVVLGIALHLAIRRRDPLLLYCFIGGGLAALFEPVADILSHLYFPAVDQDTAYTTFDRPIPWALVFAYPWFVGGQGYLTYRLLASRPAARTIWMLWGAFALSNVAVETPGVLSDFHVYYGEQPFNPWGFPLWQAAVQSVMPLAAGALVYVARRHLGTSWRLAVVVPLIPMADGMANAGLALPVWTTLGSDMSLAANYVGGTLTIAMSAVAVWVLTMIFARKQQPPAEAAEPRELAAAVT